MKQVESKVVQNFIGKIAGKTIHNEDLYCNLEALTDTLCDRLQNIDIPKEDELINDFIDSISNIYKLSDITLDDIYDAIYTSIIGFNAKHDSLDELEFSLFKDYIDEALTKEYFGFINDRLKSGYYLSK